jgi:flagellar M-ring protein FliF
VVVNDRMTTEGAGKALHEVWKPRTSDEMHRLEQLAQAAVGFDDKRGDQVVMENVSFSSNAPEIAATGTDKLIEQAKSVLSTQPAMMKTAVMGLLGVMLVMLVLKPVAGQMVATMKEPLLLHAGDGIDGTGDSYGVRAVDHRSELGAGAPGGVALHGGKDAGNAAVSEEQGAVIFDAVTSHIKREPVHSTRLLEAWITSEGDD